MQIISYISTFCWQSFHCSCSNHHTSPHPINHHKIALKSTSITIHHHKITVNILLSPFQSSLFFGAFWTCQVSPLLDARLVACWRRASACLGDEWWEIVRGIIPRLEALFQETCWYLASWFRAFFSFFQVFVDFFKIILRIFLIYVWLWPFYVVV